MRSQKNKPLPGANCAVLPCGLRLIHVSSATDVCYAGYAIKAGTRYELPHEQGFAHLTEHMLFKGTEERNARHIPGLIERVGGELNAYTTKEEVVVYSVFMKEHLQRAIALMTDMVFHSTFPAEELDKEIEVVCSEIATYKDSPGELIFDEFEEWIFRDHPLGRSILGDEEGLRSVTRKALTDFVGRLYRPDNAIFFIKGNVQFEKIINICKNLLGKSKEKEGNLFDFSASTFDCKPLLDKDKEEDGSLKVGKGTPQILPEDKASTSPIPEKAVSREMRTEEGNIRFVSRQTHQAHVMMGGIGYEAERKERTALCLLMNLLGGPYMNSRLNMVLRERYGLVYQIEANFTGYTDSGIWNIYFGCDPEDTERCIRLVKRELARLKEKPLSKKALAEAKRQMAGALGIATDNFEHTALNMAKRYLHWNTFEERDDVETRIKKLDQTELQHVAQELFDEKKIYTLIFGA